MNFKFEALHDAVLAAIKKSPEWTIEQALRAMSSPKSKAYVHYYFNSKVELIRATWAHYVLKARNAHDISVDLAFWISMREDPLLKAAVLADRENRRDGLKIEFNGHVEAWLAQALHVGLGVMRELEVAVDEEAVKALFKDLVFQNQARFKTPEMKAGVDAALSA